MQITDFLALYAAVLSTALPVIGWWRSRRALVIDMMLEVGSGSSEGTHIGAAIFVRNVKTSPVEVQHVGLIWPYRKVSWREKIIKTLRYRRPWWATSWVHGSLPNGTETNMPALVEGWRSLHIYLDRAALLEQIVESGERTVRATVQDALGQTYYSGPFEVPVIKPSVVVDDLATN